MQILIISGKLITFGLVPPNTVSLVNILLFCWSCWLNYHGRSQCFPIQVTGWPLELKAFAYLAVSPPSLSNQFDEVWFPTSFILMFLNFIKQYLSQCVSVYCYQMAAAASNKSTAKKDLNYPDIEEEALQFILDSCETSISKYNKFLQVTDKECADSTILVDIDNLNWMNLWFLPY